MNEQQWSDKLQQLGTEADAMHDALARIRDGLHESAGLTKLERAGADMYLEKGFQAYRGFIKIHDAMCRAEVPAREIYQKCEAK